MKVMTMTLCSVMFCNLCKNLQNFEFLKLANFDYNFQYLVFFRAILF